MSGHVAHGRRQRGVAAATCLLAAAAVMLPAAGAGADGADRGKGAELQRLRSASGGSRPSSATTTLRHQLDHQLDGRLGTGRHPVAAHSAAAVAADPPATTPTDVTVTGTAGVVTISATSTAPFVLFAADDLPVAAPVAVTAGTATVEVATWGWANGTYSVTGADCTAADPASCNPVTSAPTALDLANAAPHVTAPPNGGQVTGGFTITATSPGGGLRFLIDGTRRGFDGAAPYTFAFTGSALSPGRHVITAVACSTDESQCDGPSAVPVTITSNSLHPRITSVSPSTFSPNGDRYKDTTRLTYTLPDPETVYVTVTTASGVVVRGPSRLGPLARGTHAWVWNGRANGNRGAASGTYRITLSTSATVHGAVVRGLVWHGVVLDNRAPAVTSLSRGTAVYPYRDGYKDTLPVRFRLDERAVVTLTVRNSTRHVVRTLSTTRNPGVVSLAWNGRDAHGRAVPAGRYTWQLSLRDEVGNHRSTARYAVTVSGKRLVSKSTTILRNGDSFASAGASDPSCAEARTDLSDYPHGVWLANACIFGTDIAAAFYHVSVPAAAVYSRFTVQVYGWAMYAPTSMLTGFGRRGGSSDFGIGGYYTISGNDERWYTIGSINAADYVSSTHRANIAVTVTSEQAPCDFDVKQVRIKLSYKVLR